MKNESTPQNLNVQAGGPNQASENHGKIHNTTTPSPPKPPTLQFQEIVVGYFEYRGRRYHKLALSMASDEDRNGTVFMAQVEVLPDPHAPPGDPNHESSWFLICLIEYSAHMKHVVLIFLFALSSFAQSTDPFPTTTKAAKMFDDVADSALAAMTKRAEELKIHGAALVAYIEGETTKSWSSKMVVVDSMKDTPTEKSHGNNLLAIAYSKAAEMAETLKDSGHAGRPPMTGETGWQGGLIKKGKSGYLIAAFSGGPSESDLKVSQAGLEALAEKL